MNLPRSIFLAGATACGKSAVALELARRLDGEIISVDSMQVYRGMDIGTAKPTPAEQSAVTHHLLDVSDLTERFDAARFVELAKAAQQAIHARGKTAVFCGGTGLYFKAYLEGLGDAPPSDEAMRAKLEKIPLGILLDELQSTDPETYHKIDKNNPRRVIRAVEVIRLTGKPFSQQRSQWSAPETSASGRSLICLERASVDLQKRIVERVDHMFRAGLVAETRELLRHGLAENKTAMQSIGYRQVVAHLQGEFTLPQTVEWVKIRTRQFAKRQGTWFRGQASAKWISCGERETVESIGDRVLEAAL